MLDRPGQPVSVGQGGADLFIEPIGGDQRGDCVNRRRRAYRRIATAVDHLLDLDEELDLANAPAAPLEVVTGADMRPLREMVPNPRGNLPHLVYYAEIERAAPHERLDRVEEALAKRNVTGRGASADERGAFPRQRAGLIMGDSGIHWQSDRRDFGRRTKAEVDPLDVAVGGALLEQFDDPPADADSRLARIVAAPLGQGLGVEQEQ